MKPFNETYFNTLSQAIDQVQKFATKRGFILDGDETFLFCTGGVKYGETKRESLGLYKPDGALTKNKMLHLQVYRMETGIYELNYYIN